jgi:hypothetical protein
MVTSLPTSEAFTGWPTVGDIDDYFTLVGNSAWGALSTGDKAAARNRAVLALETLKWNGERAVSTQPWSWPRIDMTCNGWTAEAGTIPPAIVQALSELSLAMATNPTALSGVDPADPRWTRREKLDVLEIEYGLLDAGPTRIGSSFPLVLQKFPWLKPLLECWAELGGTAVRLYRN